MRWGRKKGLRRIAGRVAHWHVLGNKLVFIYSSDTNMTKSCIELLEPEKREYKISKTLEKIFRQPYSANL